MQNFVQRQTPSYARYVGGVIKTLARINEKLSKSVAGSYRLYLLHAKAGIN